MTHTWLRGLFAFVLATGFLAGCASTQEEPATETPPVQPAEPVTPIEQPPAPPPRWDVSGNPIDDSGRPYSRVFYFDFDKAVLSPRDLRMLDLHAEFLKDYRDRSVVIEGHCDERGTREYNLALGERRSDAVRSYLTSAGVRASQIDTVSYGEERPANPGHDESAWRENRRSEMHYR